jgi:HAMP domain-containing protein
VSIASSISAKTALKVNLVLIVFLVAGGFGVTYYQKNHFDKLVTLEEATLEEQLLRRGAILSQIGAEAIGKLIEEAIDNTAYGVNDFFDTEYQEIPGFDPPKYHTKVDSYMDKAILSLEDEFLKDPDVVFAVAVDINGYLPTHNTKYQQPPTGDKEKDKVGNRTKRIFNDPIGIKAAQNTEEGFRQVYHRDTGETMWDISSPIMVKGKHWGGFRIGLSMKTIEQTNAQFRKKTDSIRDNFLNSLFLLMGIILLVSLVAVFFTISQVLKPLKKLTATANELANGNIDTAIPKTGSDELGQLANVLERLRISLKKSMGMLQKR